MTDIRAPVAGTGFGSVGLVLLAMFAFSTQDVVVKIIAGQVSLWQLLFIRSLLTLWLLVMVVAALGRLATLAPRAWFWPLLRAAFMCGAYLTFYASLPLLALSKAAAAFFTGPLIITLLAALLLGERIGPRRVLAIVAGFGGVVCIVRPGLEGWDPVALLPVLSAVCYAIGIVITRWRCQDEPNFALSLVHNLLYAGIGLMGMLALELGPVAAATRADWPFLTTSWMALGGLAGGLILFTAATHLVGVLCSVRAYQIDDASRVAPFEYSYLAIMPVYDVAIWGHWPEPLTLLGMALICGAGVFVAWREGRPPRPQVHPRGETPWTPDEERADKGS
ncbi:MAG: DMT family transporter [Paracoccaceae bacterium]